MRGKIWQRSAAKRSYDSPPVGNFFKIKEGVVCSESGFCACLFLVNAV